MLALLPGHDASVAEWVANGIGNGLRFYSPVVAWGIYEPGDKQLRGGIVLHDYTGANIEVSLYCPLANCWQRRFIKTVYDYVFIELKCLRLTARTKRSNKIVCRLMRRLGFDYEATLKYYYGPTKSDDAILFRLTHDYASIWM